MKISNEPLQENESVKFKVWGFPMEESIKAAIERFYKIKTAADRNFLVMNEFGETIFTGAMDAEGRISSFADAGKPGKPFAPKPE